MAKKPNKNYHWVPATKKRDDFPFAYKLREVFDFEGDPALSLDVVAGEDLSDKIKDTLVSNFPFYRFLNKYSPEYIGLGVVSEHINFFIEIKYHKFEKVKVNTRDGSEKYITKKVQVKRMVAEAYDFSSNYQFNLMTSVDQIDEFFSDNPSHVAFDFETGGLDPEFDSIVGICLSKEPRIGYYIPIKHDLGFIRDDTIINLGDDAIALVYDGLVKAEIIYAFNSRFDLRFFEFSNLAFDTSKLNVIDAQVTSWFADSNYKKRDLKTLEKHFLGYYRDDLKSTLRGLDNDNFNLGLVNPKDILFYAAQDGISTFELGMETFKYYKEFGVSGQIDMALLDRLKNMENYRMRIDIDFLREQLDIINKRLVELDAIIKSSLGDINLNSPKQKVALFESFGLDTGVKTKTGGAMSTGREAVENMIVEMENRGDDVPEWLSCLGEWSKLEKLSNTFFTSLLEQAILNNGRVRINYRNVNTATGRLSSGAEEDD